MIEFHHYTQISNHRMLRLTNQSQVFQRISNDILHLNIFNSFLLSCSVCGLCLRARWSQSSGVLMITGWRVVSLAPPEVESSPSTTSRSTKCLALKAVMTFHLLPLLPQSPSVPAGHSTPHCLPCHAHLNPSFHLTNTPANHAPHFHLHSPPLQNHQTTFCSRLAPLHPPHPRTTGLDCCTLTTHWKRTPDHLRHPPIMCWHLRRAQDCQRTPARTLRTSHRFVQRNNTTFFLHVWTCSISARAY